MVAAAAEFVAVVAGHVAAEVARDSLQVTWHWWYWQASSPIVAGAVEVASAGLQETVAAEVVTTVLVRPVVKASLR